jgi:hypothetical protein
MMPSYVLMRHRHQITPEMTIARKLVSLFET